MQATTQAIFCAALAFALPASGFASDAWAPVSSADLDGMRGGFDTAMGLRISFGIQREGYVNGKLISATRMQVADIPRLGAGHTNAISTTVARPAANTIPAPSMLLIQNALNQQQIRSLTVINATANSLELIKGLNLQSALADALAHSLGNR